MRLTIMRLMMQVLCACITMLVGTGAWAAQHVDVVYVGTAHDADQANTVVVELLERLDVAVADTRRDTFLVRDIFRPPASSGEDLVAWVWLDLRARDKAQLYVVNATRERILIRDVPLSDGLDEVAREQIGHIVEAAIETLLAGGRIGRRFADVERELGEPPSPQPAKAPPRPKPHTPTEPPPPSPEQRPAEDDDDDSGIAWIVGVQWVVQGFSDDEAISHGPGARVETRLVKDVVRFGVAFEAQYRLPITTDGSGLGVRLDTVMLRVRPQLGYALLPDLVVVAGAGIGLDLVHVDPRDQGRVLSLANDRWSAVPFLQTSLAVRGRPVSSLWLEAGLVIDHDLIDTRYVGLREGRNITVLDPWLVRPGLNLAVLWQF